MKTTLALAAMAGSAAALCVRPISTKRGGPLDGCCPMDGKLEGDECRDASGKALGYVVAPSVLAPPTADSRLGDFMRFGWLYNGAPAWGDLSGSKFVDVPPHFTGGAMTIPNSDVSPGATVRFHCPSGIPMCTATMLMYECMPCATESGGIKGDLVAAGFERTKCAPWFKTGVPSGVSHKMMAYIKTMVGGETQSFVTTERLQYATFGLQLAGVDCSAATKQGDCEKNVQCMWSLSEETCRLNPCIGKGPGRNPCTVCTRDEVVPRRR